MTKFIMYCLIAAQNEGAGFLYWSVVIGLYFICRHVDSEYWGR